jgi:hypothetical protein
MKKINGFLALFALVLSSLACQTVTGGGDPGLQPLPPVDDTEDFQPAPATEEYFDDSSDDDSSDDDSSFSFGDSDFPMPDDASNVVSVAGTTNFQTSLSFDDTLKFYRDYYGSQGYTERELLTTITDGVFSIVFDGDPSGQAIVIQGVDLGDGTVNVNISLQDI